MIGPEARGIAQRDVRWEQGAGVARVDDLRNRGGGNVRGAVQAHRFEPQTRVGIRGEAPANPRAVPRVVRLYATVRQLADHAAEVGAVLHCITCSLRGSVGKSRRVYRRSDFCRRSSASAWRGWSN